MLRLTWLGGWDSPSLRSGTGALRTEASPARLLSRPSNPFLYHKYKYTPYGVYLYFARLRGQLPNFSNRKSEEGVLG